MQNGTSSVVQSQLPLPFFVTASILLFLGILFNPLSFALAHQMTRYSKLTSRITYGQAIFNILLLCASLEVIWPKQANIFQPAGSIAIGSVYCYLVKSRYLFWLTLTAAQVNTVNASLDKLWAIVYCTTYKANYRLYWTFVCILIGVNCIILPCGRFACVHHSDLGCTDDSSNLYCWTSNVVTLVYVYLGSSVAYFYVWLSCRRVLLKDTSQIIANLMPQQKGIGDRDCEGDCSVTEQRRAYLSITKFVISASLVKVSILTYALTCQFLFRIGQLDYGLKSNWQTGFAFIEGLNSALIPIFQLIIYGSMRQAVASVFSSLWRLKRVDYAERSQTVTTNITTTFNTDDNIGTGLESNTHTH